MIVPFNKTPNSQSQPTAKPPSETDMLMALATMHSLGRVGKAAKASDPEPPAA